MKRCLLCSNKNLKLLKIIKKIDIYECERCKLGISSNILGNKKKLYNFPSYKKDEKKHIWKFRKVIRILKRFLKKGKIIEVGAGYGLFSNLLSRENSFRIELIEPNLSTNYLKNKGIKIYKTTYERFLTKNKVKYDLVVFLDVLEHFANPKEILNETKKILKRRGFILIVLPNYKSAMAKICKRWSWWMVEDHYFHFSPQSMREILRQTGFNMRYMTSFESFVDLKKNLDGNFSDVKNFILRKLLKLISMYPFLLFYLLIRSFIWKLRFGGLLFTVAQYD